MVGGIGCVECFGERGVWAVQVEVCGVAGQSRLGGVGVTGGAKGAD